jgi:hypothetical protein
MSNAHNSQLTVSLAVGAQQAASLGASPALARAVVFFSRGTPRTEQ